MLLDITMAPWTLARLVTQVKSNPASPASVAPILYRGVIGIIFSPFLFTSMFNRAFKHKYRHQYNPVSRLYGFSQVGAYHLSCRRCPSHSLPFPVIPAQYYVPTYHWSSFVSTITLLSTFSFHAIFTANLNFTIVCKGKFDYFPLIFSFSLHIKSKKLGWKVFRKQ